MPLPILQSHHSASSEDLLRYFQKLELHWGRHVGEETQLDVGTALVNPQLPEVWDANRVIGAALPEGVSPEQAYAEVEEHFASARGRCCTWAMAVGAPEAQTKPMVEYLLSRGWRDCGFDVMYLTQPPRGTIVEESDLKIIPARASFRHVRDLAIEWQGASGADTAEMHLDDPHVDALIALKDGRAAAYVAVLSVGEIGGIQDIYVAKEFQRQGIGRTMMSRAMEICARSLFRHVLVGVGPENAAAVKLYEKFGFARLGRYVQYCAGEVMSDA
jgi:ribosomal protein S18 acetylase RimI-like enzyme